MICVLQDTSSEFDPSKQLRPMEPPMETPMEPMNVDNDAALTANSFEFDPSKNLRPMDDEVFEKINEIMSFETGSSEDVQPIDDSNLRKTIEKRSALRTRLANGVNMGKDDLGSAEKYFIKHIKNNDESEEMGKKSN